MNTNLFATEFAVGQIWEYETRANEIGSRLIIVQIDTIKEENIIHISIDGLKIKNESTPGEFGEDISHMPISQEALKNSITKLIGMVDILPDYKEGYSIWREAYDSGNGGVFSITVAECVEFIEQTINQ